jgi:hypothetical protein
VCVCVCACVRACERASVWVCARARACACVCAFLRVCRSVGTSMHAFLRLCTLRAHTRARACDFDWLALLSPWQARAREVAAQVKARPKRAACCALPRLPTARACAATARAHEAHAFLRALLGGSVLSFASDAPICFKFWNYFYLVRFISFSLFSGIYFSGTLIRRQSLPRRALHLRVLQAHAAEAAAQVQCQLRARARVHARTLAGGLPRAHARTNTRTRSHTHSDAPARGTSHTHTHTRARARNTMRMRTLARTRSIRLACRPVSTP